MPRVSPAGYRLPPLCLFCIRKSGRTRKNFRTASYRPANETDVFGTAVQMEVGAMMVGKIANHPLSFDESGFARVERGAEKGCFLFGGSTIIVLLKKGCAPDLAAYLEATAQDTETPVRLGMELL